MDSIVSRLREYFEKEPSIAMAFLFGSHAKGSNTLDSDIDIAVYFKPHKGTVEWEGRSRYEDESRIWREIEEILGSEVEMVVLNRARPMVSSEALRTGIPLVIGDWRTYWDFYLVVSREAEDFREFVEDYREIQRRSMSIGEQDRARLIERLQFIDVEAGEFPLHGSMDMKAYYEDKFRRRNVERWVETLVSAAIDVAKIFLASHGRQMPSTYREVLLQFALHIGFEEEDAQGYADYARLRNILAHEYLEVRFDRINEFVQHAEPYFRRMVTLVEADLEGRDPGGC